MAEITTQVIDLNPTMRFTDKEGRLTGEAFRFMALLRRIAKAVHIASGEITNDMLADLAVSASKLQDDAVVIGKLAAGSIYVSTLFADEVVVTKAVKPSAITDITTAAQSVSVGPSGNDVVTANVPLTDSDTTGVLIQFSGFMDRPSSSSSNFGYWRLRLMRNGVEIDRTPSLFYDDNFSYQPVAMWADESPGTNPEYTVRTQLVSGPGTFNIKDSLLVCSLFKR